MMSYYTSPRNARRRMAWLSDSARTEVHIPVDVVAEEESYTITAFVPGLEANDVKIEVLDETVSISGDFIADETEETDDIRYLLRERPSGYFSRQLRLPSKLEAGEAKAEVSNGVLILRVPVAEAAKAKQITVKAK